jgi:hypothetical protein
MALSRSPLEVGPRQAVSTGDAIEGDVSVRGERRAHLGGGVQQQRFPGRGVLRPAQHDPYRVAGAPPGLGGAEVAPQAPCGGSATGGFGGLRLADEQESAVAVHHRGVRV